MFAVEDRDADGVPVRIYRPVESSEPMRALVYFHGGGYVVGSIETHDGTARALAKRTPCIVISVDYRLAPEHPYPAALDDCWTAASWVMKNAAELGIDVDRVGVGGDSVGGTLATIVGAARPRPRHAVCGSAPALSEHVIAAGHVELFALLDGLRAHARRDGLVLAAVHRRLTTAAATSNISPAAVQDMRRLPRAIVVTAEADILRDEAETYAQRMFLSGVETEGYRYDGMIHGFLRMAGVVKRSNRRSTRSPSRSGRCSTRPGARTSRRPQTSPEG